MHKLNILVLGPAEFLSTLNELKHYLKFNLTTDENLISEENLMKFDAFICHNNFLINQKNQIFLNKVKCTKILAGKKEHKYTRYFDEVINLPTTLKDINTIVESRVAKRQFHKNSSIRIKNYFLDKNEKKLSKNEDHIILTEKEIQLLQLFLQTTAPISKKKILSTVWHYSDNADTHTVETHIYRLRKKINDKFSDDNFILNDKKGYYL